ncbi:hypothetical protein [Sphingomonas sp. G-3-2-10]|uniref:hypothetical protein n=1 Tax=Sphingomonas sp. G-3-2-10 TaxID=2728838 RepID=UPI00146DC925|nr:hypothetical protein [Sphingomonas sp. G-3-2-10]NML06004.1 hypothetical protein [Sphingomonas sp. G-3-2-10]
MTHPNASEPKTPMAGGFLLAAGMILGVIGGAIANQVTIGFLVGFGAGLIAAVGIWLKDR